jgi:hypothetical protein
VTIWVTFTTLSLGRSDSLRSRRSEGFEKPTLKDPEGYRDAPPADHQGLTLPLRKTAGRGSSQRTRLSLRQKTEYRIIYFVEGALITVTIIGSREGIYKKARKDELSDIYLTEKRKGNAATGRSVARKVDRLNAGYKITAGTPPS